MSSPDSTTDVPADAPTAAVASRGGLDGILPRDRMTSGALGAAALVAAVAAPWLLDDYYLSIATMTLIFVGFTSAWNVIGGMTGQFSLGNSLFVTCGGVVSGALVTIHGWNHWAAIAAGIGGAVVLSLLISVVLFRGNHSPLTFALATLALAEIGLLLVLSMDSVGAASGVIWVEAQEEFGIDDGRDMHFWALGSCLVVLLVCWVVLRSKLGYRMRATRDEPLAAAAIGVNLFWTKTIAFAISAALTATMGAIYATYTMFVNPHEFASPVVSINVILFAVVGGLGSVRGPVIGALLLFPVGEIVRGEYADLPGLNLVILGSVIVLVVLFAPRGLSGLVSGAAALLPSRGRRTVG